MDDGQSMMEDVILASYSANLLLFKRIRQAVKSTA